MCVQDCVHESVFVCECEVLFLCQNMCVCVCDSSGMLRGPSGQTQTHILWPCHWELCSVVCVRNVHSVTLPKRTQGRYCPDQYVLLFTHGPRGVCLSGQWLAQHQHLQKAVRGPRLNFDTPVLNL